MKLWVRIVCTFMAGFLMALFPLALVGMDTAAHANVDFEDHSRGLHLVAARDWSFSWTGNFIEHHWMNNTVNINVDFTLEEQALSARPGYFTSISAQIIQFLNQYPNQDDYWEVVNRNLTQTVLHKYPELRSLTISLEILPRPRVPYTCTSTVTITDQNQIIETWRFLSPNMPFNHQARERLNVDVRYTYQPNMLPQAYPDFVPIQHQIAEALITYSHPFNSWEMINRQLAERILRDHPTLSDITLKLEALPTNELPYVSATSVAMSQPQA